MVKIRLLKAKIVHLGENAIYSIEQVGQAAIILFIAVFHKPNIKKGLPLLIKQIYSIGVLSLPIILAASFFIGMVLGLQGYTILVKYGADETVGQLVALSLVRELGPVVGGLLFAGRAGSALTAEIGHMKATEQLSSLQMIGVDPIHRIVTPRFWAGFFSLPLLVLIFNIVAIWGGYLVAVEWLGLDSGTFWSNMRSAVDFYDDILNGVIKSIVFGFMITWVSLYHGLKAVPTSEGISLSTTKTVVYSSLLILALEFYINSTYVWGVSVIDISMKPQSSLALVVGLFVISGIFSFLLLAMKISGLQNFSWHEKEFILKANFANVGGLKARSRVTIGGVNIGRVKNITLDNKDDKNNKTTYFDAIVEMSINPSLVGKIPDDTTASIRTAGLIGDNFIALTPGGSDSYFKAGDMITDTNSALVLEDLISKYLFSKTEEKNN